MPQKNLFLCQDCKTEWEVDITRTPSNCVMCGGIKFIEVIDTKGLLKKAEARKDGLIR